MTGTAYLLGVAAIAFVAALFFVPSLRARVLGYVGKPGALLPSMAAPRALTSDRAVRLVADAVRFERIGGLVEVSPYLAVSVPAELYVIWKTRMDAVADAVAQRVNERGARYAQRHRARWRRLGRGDLHYFLTEGDFRVEAAFTKDRIAAGGALGEHGEAGFQVGVAQTFTFGADPGRWAGGAQGGVARTEAVPAAAPRYVLRLRDGGRLLASVPVPFGGLTVGRDQACGVVVPDEPAYRFVSARHAQVGVDGGAVHLTDTSSNGTFRSGVRLGKGARTALPLGAEVALGSADSMLVFRVEEA